MIITDIVELDKKRVKVYLDYEFAFALYHSEVRKYGLRKDEPIEDKVYEELNEKVLPKRAKLRAMNLLTKKTYTEAKLRQKLVDGYYNDIHVNIAIAYVKSFGYINDESFARDYIEYHKSSMSMQKIKQKLMEKGIPKELITNILDTELVENQADLEEKQIQVLFEKKYKGVCPKDAKEREKMLHFFLRKGYSFSAVKKVTGGSYLDDIYN